MVGFILISSSIGAQQVTEFPLFYSMGSSELTTIHVDSIKSNFLDLDSSSTYIISIEGFTDYVGTDSLNRALSSARAENIATYITDQYGMFVEEVDYRGLGKMSEEDLGNHSIGVPEHRRVNVRVVQKADPVAVRVSDIEVDRLTEGTTLILGELQFHPGRHFLISKSVPALKQLLQILKDHPDLRIDIHGHICCGQGRKEPDGLDIDTKTMNLSHNRAHNIYTFLVNNDIDTSRLSYKGFGFSRPMIFPENSPQDAQRNRRVEIVIKK